MKNYYHKRTRGNCLVCGDKLNIMKNTFCSYDCRTIYYQTFDNKNVSKPIGFASIFHKFEYDKAIYEMENDVEPAR